MQKTLLYFMIMTLTAFMIINVGVCSAQGTNVLFSVYMIGSDLESKNGEATKDLMEMLNGIKNENITLLVAFGGSNKQYWHGVKYADLQCLYEDSLDGIFGNDNCYLYKNESANMGDYITLWHFLEFLKNYTYGRSILIFWNHGNAYLGFGNDENHNDTLELWEIGNALLDSNQYFDIIGFDACLMASLEVAYTLKDFANYMVASEDIEPGHGWDYEAILNYISNNINVTPLDWAVKIVDSYFENPNHAKYSKTLSVLNLSVINRVVEVLDSVSFNLTENLFKNIEEIGRAIHRTKKFGKNIKNNTEVSIDLLDFAINIGNTSLINALNAFIVYSRSDIDKPKAFGVSICSPYSPYLDICMNLSPSANWSNFLLQYTIVREDFVSPNITYYSCTINSTEGFCIEVNDNVGIKDVRGFYVFNGIIIGSVPAEKIGPSTYFLEKWDGYWIYLINGGYTIVPLLFEDIIEDIEVYTTEIDVNKNPAVFVLLFNRSSGEIDFYAIPYEDDQYGVEFKREIVYFEEGDEIVFYAPPNWTEVGRIVWSNETTFIYDELPEGYGAMYAVANDLNYNFNSTYLMFLDKIKPIVFVSTKNAEEYKTAEITVVAYDVSNITLINISIVLPNKSMYTEEIVPTCVYDKNVCILEEKIEVPVATAGLYNVIVEVIDSYNNSAVAEGIFYVYKKKMFFVPLIKINESLWNATITKIMLELNNTIEVVNITYIEGKLDVREEANVSLIIPDEIEVNITTGIDKINISFWIAEKDEVDIAVSPNVTSWFKNETGKELIKWISIEANYTNATRFVVKIPYEADNIDESTIIAFCLGDDNRWYAINQSNITIPKCENRTIYRFERNIAEDYILFETDKLSVFAVGGEIKETAQKFISYVGGGGGGGVSEVITRAFNELTKDLLEKVFKAKNLIYKKFIKVPKRALASMLSVAEKTRLYPYFEELGDIIKKKPEKIEGDVYKITAHHVLSKYTWTPRIIVARGDLEVDSYAALALAKAKGAPILLTKPDELPEPILKAIKKLKPREIIIVGGPKAVSKEVEAKLRKYARVTRLWGETRIETSVEIAKQFAKPKYIVIANWSASEKAAYMAYLYKAPILYVKDDELPEAVEEYLKEKFKQYPKPKIIFVDVSRDVKEKIMVNVIKLS